MARSLIEKYGNETMTTVSEGCREALPAVERVVETLEAGGFEREAAYFARIAKSLHKSVEWWSPEAKMEAKAERLRKQLAELEAQLSD